MNIKAIEKERAAWRERVLGAELAAPRERRAETARQLRQHLALADKLAARVPSEEEMERLFLGSERQYAAAGHYAALRREGASHRQALALCCWWLDEARLAWERDALAKLEASL
jgi:hypothetical protein